MVVVVVVVIDGGWRQTVGHEAKSLLQTEFSGREHPTRPDV